MSRLKGHPWAHKKAKVIQDNARNRLEEYLVTGEISDKLLKSVITLAKLEGIVALVEVPSIFVQVISYVRIF